MVGQGDLTCCLRGLFLKLSLLAGVLGWTALLPEVW